MKLAAIKTFILARLKAFLGAPTPATLVAIANAFGAHISFDQAVAIIAIATPLLVHFVPNIAPKGATTNG